MGDGRRVRYPGWTGCQGSYPGEGVAYEKASEIDRQVWVSSTYQQSEQRFRAKRSAGRFGETR